MKYTITGRNIEITESLRDAIQEKLGKLERFFSQDAEAHVTLSVEKSRQKIEVTIPVKGGLIRAEQTSSDMYVSIDLVEEAIESQLKKYKNKIIDKYQDKKNFSKEYIEQEYEDEDEIKIVKTKHFDFKPMDPEEACMQMELLGHDFFVFTNADTDQINVVYKRKNNTYGLIEPEF
ncbi:MAG: ribosome-associated translation inhibitor RaiA [Lachnospiraceae bacterium]|nr:ribosome-associated translation inhibitor RaiA [Lachnospiraceae bacterium]